MVGKFIASVGGRTFRSSSHYTSDFKTRSKTKIHKDLTQYQIYNLVQSYPIHHIRVLPKIKRIAS